MKPPKNHNEATPKKEHPAKFSASVIEWARLYLLEEVERNPSRTLTVFDPFAGTGLVHKLAELGCATLGLELEPEWAANHPNTFVGNALYPPAWVQRIDVLFSSPCYGNRMADHHDAKDACKQCDGAGYTDVWIDGERVTCKLCKGSGLSKRNTYTHVLGRKLTRGSSAEMQWGSKYRDFHDAAIKAMVTRMVPGGLIMWNIANHYRTIETGQPPVEQRVSEWHANTFLYYGCTIHEVRRVATPKNTQGANRHRVEGELLLVLRAPQ